MGRLEAGERFVRGTARGRGEELEECIEVADAVGEGRVRGPEPITSESTGKFGGITKQN